MIDARLMAGAGAGVALGLFAGSVSSRRLFGRGLETDGMRLVAALGALGVLGAYLFAEETPAPVPPPDGGDMSTSIETQDEILKAGIAYAEGIGMTIGVTTGHIWMGSCDPIGAVALKNQPLIVPGNVTNIANVAKAVLGVSDEWIWSFTYGFEGNADQTYHGVVAAFELGKQYRGQYVGGAPLT